MALCDRRALWLRDAMARREVHPRDLLDACIDRIEAANTEINAVVTLDAETARAAAERTHALIASGKTPPPLAGLPVLVKDLTATQGLRTTHGSPIYADHVPDNDDIIVARLRAAGAIVLGKTNTPEFGAGANTVNQVFGATRNPFDPSLSVGGSSGGSAAALAAGMAPLATGSDFGGSLRIPAAFCGVVGFRPSPGAVPSETRVLGFQPLWTDGPMAREVADVALMFEVMQGPDPRDPLSAGAVVEALPDAAAAGVKGLRVGVSTDLGFAPMSSAVADACAEAAARLSQAGAQVRRLDLDLAEAREVFPVLRAEDMLANHATRAEAAPEKLGANIMANLEEARRFSLADRARAGRLHAALYRRFQSVFDDVDIVLCPAVPVPPFALADGPPPEIAGVHFRTYYEWYAISWALSLVASPVIAVPAGYDAAGLPVGVQAAAARGRDMWLLQAAAAMEPTLNPEPRPPAAALD